MKIKIAILGSTGSIGKSTLEVIKKDKKHLLEYSKILEELFEKVKTKQNLTFEEMETFKKTFIKRIGYGIIYCQYFGFLPKVLFHLCFNILSPQSNPTIRDPIAKLYRRIFYGSKTLK